VLLAGANSILDISTVPIIPGGIVQLDAQNRPTIRLAVGTQLGGSGGAPTLATQFGSANLTTIFGTTPTGQAQSTFSNGVISIGSNTTIAGFNFSNVSITNYSTSNVLISGNTFTGSYTPVLNPTIQDYSISALPTIAFTGVSNVTISNNTITNPNVQSYASAMGTLDAGGTGYVCGRDTRPAGAPALLTGVCLSGNAVRLTNSSDYSIANNVISGALDEAIRLDNPNGTITVNGNTITNMRMGTDTNIGATIFVRQNTGTSTIYIDNNSITANEEGRNPIKSGGANSVNIGTTFNTTTYLGSDPPHNRSGKPRHAD
jgi:hypothetical protein